MRRLVGIPIACLLGFVMAAGADEGPGEKSKNQNQNQNQHRNQCSLKQQLRRLPVEHLTEREGLDLVYLLEEEKLARDVYLTAHERWQLTIFRRVACSERSHMAWARALVNRYGLEDPTAASGLGIFTEPRFQDLYESLTELAGGSVESALLVAAAIEEMDIRDLRRALRLADNEDLGMLYQNLLQGSRNHLRIFSRSLAQRGVTFEPAYLSPEEYQALVESPLEGGVVDATGERVCGGSPQKGS